MISLKRLLGRDEKFYDLLEASADEAQRSAKLLCSLLRNFNASHTAGVLTDLEISRRDHKRLSQEITEQLCKNFVTPLEREDIEALSSALYRIPKNVEKIGERLTICAPSINAANIGRQAAMLETATGSVAAMVRELRKKSHVEKISENYSRLQTIEGDADKLMTELLRDLFRGDLDAKEVIILKDIYEMLEKLIDRCRDAGNIVFQVVLKYS